MSKEDNFSDHNTLLVHFKMQVFLRAKKVKRSFLRFNVEEGLRAFKSETSKSEVFDNCF